MFIRLLIYTGHYACRRQQPESILDGSCSTIFCRPFDTPAIPLVLEGQLQRWWGSLRGVQTYRAGLLELVEGVGHGCGAAKDTDSGVGEWKMTANVELEMQCRKEVVVVSGWYGRRGRKVLPVFEDG